MSYTSYPVSDPKGLGRSILVLFSGGFDSIALLDKLMTDNVGNIHPVYVKASFIFNKAVYEMKAAKDTINLLREKHPEFLEKHVLKDLTVLELDIPHKGNQRDIQVVTWPYAMGLIFNEEQHYAIAVADSYSDVGGNNIRDVNKLITCNIAVSHGISPQDMPLLFYPFVQELKRCVLTNATAGIFEHAWTCESSTTSLAPVIELDAAPCGKCNKCNELELYRKVFVSKENCGHGAMPSHYRRLDQDKTGL